MDASSLLITASQLLLSLFTGAIIGIERQINNRHKKKRLGMRDFSLVALIAFLASYLSAFNPYIWPIAFGSVMLLSISLFVFESIQKLKNEELAGMTTALSFPLVFLVSSLTVFQMQFWLISTLIFIFLLILELKEKWHELIEGIDKKEVIDMSILIAIALSITPLIPHDAVVQIPLYEFATGIWTFQAVSVVKFWSVILMVSIMSFCSHFITKYAKGKNALLFATFFGGLVSSLATILLFLKSSIKGEETETEKKMKLKNLYLAYIAAASGSIAKDILLLIPLVSSEFFDKLLFPLVSIGVSMIAMTLYAFSRNTHQEEVKITERPLPLQFIWKFSFIFSLVFVGMVVLLHYASGKMVIVASFFSAGVSSAASLASLAQIFENNGISETLMAYGILTAFVGSFAAKYFFIGKILGYKNTVRFLFPIAVMLIIGLLTFSISFL